MANPHGSFIWYELITSDPDAAATFYADVVGWTVAPFDGPAVTQDGSGGGMDYRVFSAADVAIAGLLRAPDPAMKPGWLGYIGVDDVDASVAAVEQAGGAVHMAATDIPGVGRMALLADPGGAPFYVMRGAVEGTSTAFSYTLAGHCSWNELVAADLAVARDFYLGRFGWSQTEAMPMGEMGDYLFLDHADARIGAMMQSPPGWGPPHWKYYFRVADIDIAVDRVKRGGGTITHGPIPVPGGDSIIQGIDPQGAPFALVGKPG